MEVGQRGYEREERLGGRTGRKGGRGNCHQDVNNKIIIIIIIMKIIFKLKKRENTKKNLVKK